MTSRKKTRDRQAAGLATLHATWQGEFPKIGDYLKSSTPQARTAYRIVDIIPMRNSLELVCERVHPSRIEAGAMVHQWSWNKRGKGSGPGHAQSLS